VPNLLLDLRYAIRSLRNAPAFTAVAVLTLALGVGANSAIFCLINATLLRPLPYDQPERLVLVWESAPFFGLHDSPVSPANYVDWRARAKSFEEMGGLEDNSYRLTGDGNPEVVRGGGLTSSAFRALRTRPALGRLFRAEEDLPGAQKVVVLSDAFWRRRFNADPNVLGKTITLSDEKHTIIGVLAPGTEPPSEYNPTIGELWTNLGSSYSAQRMSERGRHNWMVIARLRPDVTLQQADSEMRGIGENLAREYPDTNEKVGAFVAPLREHFVSARRSMLAVLLGTVACILLIACSNLANLLLSRAANRSKEVAVRAALGAGALQLVRRFLMESLVLCGLGSALGLLFATSTLQLLTHLAPDRMAGLNTLSIDWRVLVFTLAVALGTALLFGLIPLLQIRRLDVSHCLKQSARSLAASTSSSRLRSVLICSEVALAFVLLIGAGLLIQTFARLRAVDVGCRTQNILTMKVPPPKSRRGPAQSAAFQREILQRVQAIPGVVSAGFANHIPLVMKGDITGVGAEGRGEKERFQCHFRMAGPGYLSTMGIPLRLGRDIEERDAEGTPLVGVINETMGRTLWPGQDPLGRSFLLGASQPVQVIGVIADVHQAGLDTAPKPEFYLSALQVPYPPSSLAIHTRVNPISLAPAVRQAIWSVDADQPITDIATMEQVLDREVLQRRVQTMLLTGFAALALILSAIGLYGVLAYIVGQRTPEIGLRMALGAAPLNMLRQVVGHALKLTLIGIAIGVAGALAVSRLIGAMLFGIKPTDPMTFVAVGAVLLLTATLASYLPARRAMRVDPIIALREE